MFHALFRCAQFGLFLAVAIAGFPSPTSAEPLIFSGGGTNTFDSPGHRVSSSADFDVPGAGSVANPATCSPPRLLPGNVLNAEFLEILRDPRISLEMNRVVDPDRILNSGTRPGGAESTTAGKVAGREMNPKFVFFTLSQLASGFNSKARDSSVRFEHVTEIDAPSLKIAHPSSTRPAFSTIVSGAGGTTVLSVLIWIVVSWRRRFR